jgi:hypothetical protein
MSAKISIIAAALVALTWLPMTPVNAQAEYVNTNPAVEARLSVVENSIDDIFNRGLISQEQYDHLMDRVSRIRDKDSKIREHGGLTAEQQAELFADLRGLDGELAYFGVGTRAVARKHVSVTRVYRPVVKRHVTRRIYTRVR